MSLPGFPGGGGSSDIFNGAASFSGRSMRNNNINNVVNNNHLATTFTTHNLPRHPIYQTQPQPPSIFLDPSSQITQHQTSTAPLIGKRTLAEFQTQNHNLHNNPVLSNLLLRSVKPRTFRHGTPIDFSTTLPELSNPYASFQSPRLGMPVRQNTINFPYQNSNLAQVQNRVVAATMIQQPEKKIIDHRLLELEKQLLEDNEEGDGEDAVSVITNSEWYSETIQNLITPTQKPVSSSPTSSTTSSNSCSSSAASPSFKQLLTEAASAISEGKFEAASEILSRLVQTPNSDHRFTDCMVSALKSRINQIENPPPVVELFSKEHAESTQLLFENSLCFKVSFMAANLSILEAAFDESTENVKLCVVDFDIANGNGKQYASLLHELHARLNGKHATVRITAVENGGDERLKTVGEFLGRQAEKLKIGFEFNVVLTQKLAELTRESFGCDSDEVLAVNFAFKLFRMADESVSTDNPRDELLRRVKALEPRVVTVVEQEINTNTAPFAARVAESCSYYGALFESIEATMARDNTDRVKIEEGLSRKVGNAVACEGRDRVERCEVFGKWRARMSMAGFRLNSPSQKVAESIKARLASGSRVTVKEENGGICFGWMGKTLIVASAWR